MSFITLAIQTSNLKTFPPSLVSFPFPPNSKKPPMASWSCSKCTYLNPPSQKLHCQVCLSPSFPLATPSSSSSSSPLRRWPCRACTFSNPYSNTTCEVCGTRAAPFSTLADSELDPDELSDPSIGSVFLPLQRCGSKRPVAEEDRGTDLGRSEKAPRKEEVVVVASPSLGFGHADTGSNQNILKILSYNVWFNEELEVHKRMRALGDLIQQHSPDFICFQEVTPNIYEIFQNSKWWKAYKCSLSWEMATERGYFCMQMSKLPVTAFSCKPFANSIMGRELCSAEIDVGMGNKLVIATSHLESPCPGPPRWDQMYSKERVAQAKESVLLLKDYPNVIFGGDMNWDDKLDGPFPLNDGWIDAWTELKPQENGWTYDTKSNQMLKANRTLQKRLDRFLCNLRDFKVDSIEMIGKEAILGISYCKEKKVRKEIQKLELPVLPSDHYGLLLTIQRL